MQCRIEAGLGMACSDCAIGWGGLVYWLAEERLVMARRVVVGVASYTVAWHTMVCHVVAGPGVVWRGRSRSLAWLAVQWHGCAAAWRPMPWLVLPCFGVTWHDMACCIVTCLCLMPEVPETAEALFCLAMEVSIFGGR